MRLRVIIAAATALAASACAAQQERERAFAPVGLLAFGDHGYHMEYFTAEDLAEAPRTPEAFIAEERMDWIEGRRPPDEFEASPMHRLANGGYVPASGMMPVAQAMRTYCQTTRCDAGVMLGDNIYPDGATLGADGRSDAQRFEDIFRVPYGDFGDLAEGFRIYAALGNHDWNTSREGAMAEAAYLERTPPFYMDGIVYSVRPPAGRGEVAIFVIDTHVLLSGDIVYEDILAPDASEMETTTVDEPDPWARPQTELERNMVAWLDGRLRNSNARWPIVIGHHPIWSSAGSKFQQARTLRRLLMPTLCRYADMYLAGHEHTLEVHQDSCADVASGLAPLTQVVSGAAAKQRPLNSAFMAHQARNNPQLNTLWSRGMVWGFAHISLEADEARVEIVTTPDEAGGEPVSAYTHTFARRGAAH